MRQLSNLNDNFEYKLLNETQQCYNLREILIGLYPTYYADILWLELEDPSLANKGYYKLFYYVQNILKHIILFECPAKAQEKIVIINTQFIISEVDIQNISCILLFEFKRTQQIIFRNIFNTNPKQLPKILFERTLDDVIIDLPESMDAYMKSMKSSVRKPLVKRLNHIAKDFPDFKVHYFEKDDILFEDIKNLVLLNRNRMKAKGIISLNDDTLLYQYVAKSGFGSLCLCEIDGKIVSGQVMSIIGEHATGHLIALDESYKKYSIGNVALINAIKYLIEKKNIKYFHLLDGTLEYKVDYGGVIHDLYTFKVFRNSNISYFRAKTRKALRTEYKKLRQRLRSHESLYRFYFKLKKMSVKIKDI